ncbi:MAG: 3-hydroxyacyl-CoA dehydrogenase NAD-binding domain-containing protein [Chloroflexota bacterium]|nr:3-hydroxyacyl-CoA dehydrogenase NAD-binding domain-containing protein [Chloroflexota bacterium]
METKNIFVVCSQQTKLVSCAISQIAASADFTVTLKCDDEADCTKANEKIKENLQAKLSTGELTEEQVTAATGRIKTTTNLGDAKDAGIIIESLFEDESLIRKNLVELDQICNPGTIILTNTPTLTVTSLAKETTRPERIIGMHFIYFAPIMKVVEIVRGMLTSDTTFSAAEEFAKKLGQEIAISDDSPGFLSTRIWMVQINEAANNAFNKLADPAGLAKLNRTISPKALSILESADFIGLDNCVAKLQNLYNAYGETRFKPSPLLVQMVDGGQLGVKTGRGFFNYS